MAFFRTYSGSGLVIHSLARRQRTSMHAPKSGGLRCSRSRNASALGVSKLLEMTRLRHEPCCKMATPRAWESALDLGLAHRCALVTGSSQRIGLAIARVLASEDADAGMVAHVWS